MPRRKTDEEFKVELKEKRPDLEPLTFYSGDKHKMKYKHLPCGTIFWTTPHCALRSCSCPKCAIDLIKEKEITPLKEMLKKLKRVWGNLIIYVDGYDGIGKPCIWKCAVDGHIWKACPHDILRGHGCPVCAFSSMEKPVEEFLNKKKIKYKHNVGLKGSNFNGSRLPLRPDFYIETNKGVLVIETDGQQHFLPVYGEQELRKTQERDAYKNKLMKEYGWVMVRVTSSLKWGTSKHILLEKLIELLNVGIDEKGNIDLDVFKPYDFNRE